MNVLTAAPHIPRSAILPEIIVELPFERLNFAMFDDVSSRHWCAQNLHTFITDDLS
jgi:hypothetical protein